jgi:hypothetical protein
MRQLLLLLYLCLVLQTQGQNLSGTWVGSSGNSADYVRLELIHIGDSLYGTSYDEGGGFCKANFSASYNAKNVYLKGKCIDFIDRTPNHSLVEYSLYYSKSGANEYLKGTSRLKSILAKLLTMGMGSPTILRKVSDRVDTTVFMRAQLARLALPPVTNVKKEPVEKKNPPPVVETPKEDAAKPVVPTPPPVVLPKTDTPTTVVPPTMSETDRLRKEKEQRSSPLIKAIATTADSLQLLLYDEGEIDGDRVTVFVNNEVVLKEFLLTARPAILTVAVNKQQPVEVVLVANNLGSIPPNTALVVITDGNQRHEVRASFDLNVNARIVIQYRQ